MFVRVVQKSKDHVSVRIVENFKKDGKVKQRNVCGVGYSRKDDIEKIESFKRIGEELIVKIKNEIMPSLIGFEEIVHAPKKKKRTKETENKKNDDSCSLNNLKEEARIRVGTNDVFANEFEQIGLLDAINSGYKQDESNKLLKEVVLSRIDKPASKRKSVEYMERDKNKEVDLDAIYRMMDKINDREDWIKEKIARETLSLFKDRIRVAFFDVTTLYFESFIPDELRVSGYSKDNKVKETQVMLALMTTEGGLPLGYELFPGNTYEGSTLISAVDELCKRYKVVDTSLVADRAMFSRKNLKSLDERGVNFIVSAKLKKMKKETKEKILGDVEKVLEGGDVKSWVGEYEYDKRRLVIGYSEKRASKDRRDRERLIKRVEKKLKDGKVKVSALVKNTGTKKYLKFEKNNKETAILDEEKIKEAQRWDGIYGIVSSHDKEKVSGGEIFERYRGLWQVEDAFRVNKRDLKMRPIYHWTPKRIKSHILICYMAYALVARVKYKLKKAKVKLSIERIREELGYLQASVVRDQKTGQRFLLPSKVTNTQRAICDALGVKLQEKIQILK